MCKFLAHHKNERFAWVAFVQVIWALVPQHPAHGVAGPSWPCTPRGAYAHMWGEEHQSSQLSTHGTCTYITYAHVHVPCVDKYFYCFLPALWLYLTVVIVFILVFTHVDTFFSS